MTDKITDNYGFKRFGAVPRRTLPGESHRERLKATRDAGGKPHRMHQMPPAAKAKMRIHRAYTALLRVPHDTPSREVIQPALAVLRDELARLMNVDPQNLQDEYEARIEEQRTGRITLLAIDPTEPR